MYFGGIFGSLRTLNCPARTSQFHHEYLMILSILSIFATNNNTNNMNSWTQYNRKEKYNSIQYNSRQLSLTLCVVFYRPFAVNAISNRRRDHNQIIYRYIYMQKIQNCKEFIGTTGAKYAISNTTKICLQPEESIIEKLDSGGCIDTRQRH